MLHPGVATVQYKHIIGSSTAKSFEGIRIMYFLLSGRALGNVQKEKNKKKKKQLALPLMYAVR